MSDPGARPTRAQLDATEASAAEWRTRALAAERRLRLVVRALLDQRDETGALAGPAAAMLAGVLGDLLGLDLNGPETP